MKEKIKNLFFKLDKYESENKKGYTLEVGLIPKILLVLFVIGIVIFKIL